jgi:RNA polymerase sigma-70 factor (ECF subfamily)
MPNANNLASTVSRAREGQTQAISELYTTFADLLFRYCYVRLHDREAAQDCVQETFIRAWRGIKTFEYRGDLSLTSWLYTITNHVVVSYVRKQQRAYALPCIGEIRFAEAHAADLANAICDRLALCQALSNLTSEQQHVIMLKFFAGLSNHEIATVLHRTEGAVKALQYRALSRLAQLLTPEREPPLTLLGLSAGT